MDRDRTGEGRTMWNFNKGVPCRLENLADVVHSCYNHLVSCLAARKVNASIVWYNNEIYTCACKVSAVLNDQEFVLPERCDNISCDKIISSVQDITKHVKMTCGVFHALESLLVCTGVIWRLKCTDQLEADVKCSALEKCLTTVPLDCAIEDGGRCERAVRYTLSCLKSVPAESRAWESLSEKQSMLQYMTYVAAFSQHQVRNFRGCLNTLHSFLLKIEGNHDYIIQRNLSNIFNLAGCCYASLGLHHTAIVYFRKALLRQESNFACLLKNTAAVYVKLGKFDAASQAADILASSFQTVKATDEGEPILVFHIKSGLRLCSSTDISHWGWPTTMQDSNQSLYLAGNMALLARKFEITADYYQQILSPQNHMLTLGTAEVCFPIPTKEQILAEKQLAISECSSSLDAKDAKSEFAEVRNALAWLSNKLDHIVHEPGQEPDSSVLEDFVAFGKKLYHCLCNTLCLSKGILSKEDRLCSGHEPFGSWEPKVYDLSERNWSGVSEGLMNAAKKTVRHLNSIQGKFLLNKAIWMTYTDRKSQALKVLPSVLKFAPQDREIRWKITLLLWKMGEKSEACKTWLRTRGIDYRMSGIEVKNLVHKMLAADVPNHTRILYRRDIAILKAVYINRQSTN